MNNTTEALLFDYQKTLRSGLVVIFVGFGGFMLWAFIAQMSSASLAQGKIVAESNVKTIEHLEGGIIQELHVNEGDRVKKGDLLLALSPTQAKSRLNQLRTRKMSDAIRLARLQTEQVGGVAISFPEVALHSAKTNIVLAGQIAQQKILFKQRKSSLDTKVSIYKQQLQQLSEKVIGLKNEKLQVAKSLGILQEEVAMYEELTKTGSMAKIQQMELVRKESELQGYMHKLNGQVAVTKQQRLEVSLKIDNEKKVYLNKIHEQIDQLQQGLAETNDALSAAADVLERIEIISPVDGVVVSMHKTTIGGVVKPGDAILDITPLGDLLIVEALASAQDINVLQVGQSALVRLTAYNFRELSPIEATLTYVSADLIEDPRRETAGYRIKLKLDADKVPDFVELYPGMSAEVMVITGSRTLIQYLLDPLFDTFYKAFRES